MIDIGLIFVDVLGRCWTRASGDERHVIRWQEVSEKERVYIIVAFVERRPRRFQFVGPRDHGVHNEECRSLILV